MTSRTRHSCTGEELYRPGDGRSVVYYYHSQEIDVVDCVHAVCHLGTRKGVDGVRTSCGSRRSRRPPSRRSPRSPADSSSHDQRLKNCLLGLYYLWLKIDATAGSSPGHWRRPPSSDCRICLSNYCLTIEVVEVSWWPRRCLAASSSRCPGD